MRYQNAFTRGCSYSVPRIYPFRNARLGRCFRGRRTITIFPDLSLPPQLYSRIVPRQLHFSLVPRVTFSSHSSRFTNDSFKRSLSIPLFSREIRKKKSALVRNRLRNTVDIHFSRKYTRGDVGERVGINKDYYRRTGKFERRDAVLYYYRSTPYKLVALIYTVSHVVTQQSVVHVPRLIPIHVTNIYQRARL